MIKTLPGAILVVLDNAILKKRMTVLSFLFLWTGTMSSVSDAFAVDEAMQTEILQNIELGRE